MAKRVIVVGAGVWGGWTAFHLQQAGCQVTLIDKEGPGNVLTGSGGKTRIIRMAYGGSEVYTNLTEESFEMWEKYSREWNDKLFHEKGALWMFRGIEPTYAEMSIPIMQKKGYELSKVSVDSLKTEYPEMNLNDISSAYWEPKVAYLEASRSCGVVRDKFVERGGQYLKAEVTKLKCKDEQISAMELSSGEVIEADFYVLACGPWLKNLVPEMNDIIRVSRQEVYYFEAPDTYNDLPIWVEFREGDQMFYGIPDHFDQGFKFAYDERTWGLDPDKDHRNITEGILERMKSVLVNRFPKLKSSDVLKHHVCVYENSTDGDFIIDRLPQMNNTLVLAGSSGHGFKMGPAIGQLVTQHITTKNTLPKGFALTRFSGEEVRKSQYEL